MVSPATGHVDTEWFDVFWAECQKLGCRIDYLATHLYRGTPDERIDVSIADTPLIHSALF